MHRVFSSKCTCCVHRLSKSHAGGPRGGEHRVHRRYGFSLEAPGSVVEGGGMGREGLGGQRAECSAHRERGLVYSPAL